MSSSFIRQASVLLGSGVQSMEKPTRSLAPSFSPISVNTSELSALGVGAAKTVPVEGQQLLYRRVGSSPSFPLYVALNSGTPVLMLPGERIVAPFQSVDFWRAKWFPLNSPIIDVRYGEFIAIGGEGDFYESKSEYGAHRASWLSGSADAMGFSVTEDTEYNDAFPGANINSGFYAAGFRRVRLHFDLGVDPANVVTSFTLIPWVFYVNHYQANNPVLYDGRRLEAHQLTFEARTTSQVTSAVDWDIPTAALDFERRWHPTSSKFLTPAAPWFTFEVRDLLPAAATDVRISVEGLE